MALKKILEIDVQDDSFRAFQELFEKHKKQVDELPQGWVDTGASIEETSAKVAEIIAATSLLLGETEKIRKSYEHYNLQVDKTKRGTAEIEHHSSGIARHIAQATKEFLKWDAIITGIGGLIGAGGLFGIERLAQTAATTRRTSLGLNLSPQDLQSARINFGRYFDPNSVLGNISEAQVDIHKQGWFAGTGITQEQVRSQSSFRLMEEEMLKLKAVIGNKLTPENVARANAMGFGHFFSTQDMRRIAATPAPVLQASIGQAEKDRQALAIPAGTRLAWTNFLTQLDRAGTQISNVFIRDLAPLAPNLSALSASFAGAIDAFLKAPAVKDGINELSVGLKALATYVGSPKFKKDAEEFANELEKLAEVTFKVVKWLASWIPSSQPKVAPPAKSLYDYKLQEELYENGLGPKPQLPKGPLPEGKETSREEIRKFFQQDHAGPVPAPWGGGSLYRPQAYSGPVPPVQLYQAAYRSWGSAGGAPLPAPWAGSEGYGRGGSGSAGVSGRLLDSIAWVESHNNPNAVSPKGAKGEYQFMDATARQYGVTNPFNPVQEREAAGRLFSDLLRHFGGDRDKAIAAYNAGQGTVDRDISRHGSAWRDFLPNETKAYLGRVLEAMRGVGARQVRVQNNTGGSAIVTTSQLAI